MWLMLTGLDLLAEEGELKELQEEIKIKAPSRPRRAPGALRPHEWTRGQIEQVSALK